MLGLLLLRRREAARGRIVVQAMSTLGKEHKSSLELWNWLVDGEDEYLTSGPRPVGWGKFSTSGPLSLGTFGAFCNHRLRQHSAVWVLAAWFARLDASCSTLHRGSPPGGPSGEGSTQPSAWRRAPAYLHQLHLLPSFPSLPGVRDEITVAGSWPLTGRTVWFRCYKRHLPFKPKKA